MKALQTTVLALALLLTANAEACNTDEYDHETKLLDTYVDMVNLYGHLTGTMTSDELKTGIVNGQPVSIVIGGKTYTYKTLRKAIEASPCHAKLG